MKTARIKENIYGKVLLGAGMLLRLFYVVTSSIYDRQYDIGMISLDAHKPITGGHLGYIQYIYEYMKIPDVDPTSIYQFHHPPVHHVISALWMHFLGLFIHNNQILEESLQVIPFICSIITLVIAYRIIDMTLPEAVGRNAAYAVFSFHPALVLLSGSVNNDAMSLCFTFLVIFYALKWARETTCKNIVFMAIFLGLGISTKQNVAECAFFLLPLFIYKLWVSFKEAGAKKLFLEYIVFGIISIPLGMWFFIRNLIKYNVSMLWVYDLTEDSWQYTGNYPVFNRFFIPDIREFIDNITHFRIGCGYNVWISIMRTSVLGEWDMASTDKKIKILAVLLMLAGAMVALWAFIYFLKDVVFGKDFSKPDKIIFVGGYLVTMIFYLSFVYKYPQECSMNFRYIVAVLLFQSAALGFIKGDGTNKIIKSVFNITLVIFCLLSVAMIAFWCLFN